MSADKRSTHTDALATLGTIISAKEKRDAIHLAVIPMIAGENLYPGQHVYVARGLQGNEALASQLNHGVGIVDPFLIEPVARGEHFWLVIYPRQITSLRHVWEHPAFPNEEITA